MLNHNTFAHTMKCPTTLFSSDFMFKNRASFPMIPMSFSVSLVLHAVHWNEMRVSMKLHSLVASEMQEKTHAYS
jgi:hypothetical protein